MAAPAARACCLTQQDGGATNYEAVVPAQQTQLCCAAGGMPALPAGIEQWGIAEVDGQKVCGLWRDWWHCRSRLCLHSLPLHS